MKYFPVARRALVSSFHDTKNKTEESSSTLVLSTFLAFNLGCKTLIFKGQTLNVKWLEQGAQYLQFLEFAAFCDTEQSRIARFYHNSSKDQGIKFFDCLLPFDTIKFAPQPLIFMTKQDNFAFPFSAEIFWQNHNTFRWEDRATFFMNFSGCQRPLSTSFPSRLKVTETAIEGIYRVAMESSWKAGLSCGRFELSPGTEKKCSFGKTFDERTKKRKWDQN